MRPRNQKTDDARRLLYTIAELKADQALHDLICEDIDDDSRQRCYAKLDEIGFSWHDVAQCWTVPVPASVFLENSITRPYLIVNIDLTEALIEQDHSIDDLEETIFTYDPAPSDDDGDDLLSTNLTDRYF